MTKPEYSLGPQTIVNMQPQETLIATAIVGLHPDKLQIVGKEAARAAGMPFMQVTIEPERDISDGAAYLFSYLIPPNEAVTGKMRSRLLGELRDRLLALGNEHYPYVALR